MYWQKRLDRTASTQIIEEEIQAIRKKHQHYGYRRITQELKRRGFQVNKKKVQRLIQKLQLIQLNLSTLKQITQASFVRKNYT